MGVLGLWEILQDVQTHKTKEDLLGKTLAIDLAMWICEAESVKPMKNAISKPYLRNLFFRVTSLTRNGIKPIFIIDGKAPKLKWDTMAKRMNARKEPTSVRSHGTGSRSRLNARFNECCKLLDCLGVPWIKSAGEAEATCAALNMDNIVDGCVTNDGDCFLYGAKIVYRNLTVDSKGISTECYKMKDIESKLSLNRSSLIALGLILGCDYCPQGIPGIGRVHAIQIVSKFKGDNCIKELKLWKSKEVVNISKKKPAHCSTCKHEGSKNDHVKYGCNVCNTDCRDGINTSLKCNCVWHETELERKTQVSEESIRQKINKVENFPNQTIINEFLKKISVQNFHGLTSRKPAFELAVDFLTDKLDWPKQYCIKKTLPLFTYWVLHNEEDRNKELQLIRIIKKRKVDGVSMFELEWECDIFDEIEAITIEPQDQVESAYPKIVEEFWSKIENKKKSKKQPKKKKNVIKENKAEIPASNLTTYFKVKKPRDLKIEEKLKNHKKKIPKNDGENLDDVIFVSETKPTDLNNNNLNILQSSPKRPADTFVLESAFKSVKISDEENLEPSLPQSCIKSSEINNISFDLNFSLGNSLLRTPMIEKNAKCQKENFVKISEKSRSQIVDSGLDNSTEDMFGNLSLNHLSTPVNIKTEPIKLDHVFINHATNSVSSPILMNRISKTQQPTKPKHLTSKNHVTSDTHVTSDNHVTSDEESGSPVYISLMERLKL